MGVWRQWRRRVCWPGSGCQRGSCSGRRGRRARGSCCWRRPDCWCRGRSRRGGIRWHSGRSRCRRDCWCRGRSYRYRWRMRMRSGGCHRGSWRRCRGRCRCRHGSGSYYANDDHGSRARLRIRCVRRHRCPSRFWCPCGRVSGLCSGSAGGDCCEGQGGRGGN